MKKYATLLFLFIVSIIISAQNEVDGKLTLNGFTFSNDAFGSHIYQDQKGNKIILTRQFLDEIELSNSLDINKILFFDTNASSDKNFKEKYDVNAGGQLVYKNNRGALIKIEEELFDEIKYSESIMLTALVREKIIHWDNTRIERKYNISVFKSRTEEITIKNNVVSGSALSNSNSNILGESYETNIVSVSKNIFDIVEIKDSKGNKVSFSKEICEGMMKKHKSEEAIFAYLISKYL